MENCKNIIKLVEKWSHENRWKPTQQAEREDLFIEELNSTYILIERKDVHKIEVVYKSGIEPSEDIIYCDADHKAMDEINKEIDDRTDDLAEEDVDWKYSQTKDIPWNRLIMTKDTVTEKQANVIINNFDLFL